MDSKYFPWLFGGGLVLVLFLLLRGGNSPGASSNYQFQNVQPLPADHSSEELQGQERLAYASLRAQEENTLLAYDLQLKQLSTAERVHMADIAATLQSIGLTNTNSAIRQSFNAQTAN